MTHEIQKRKRARGANLALFAATAVMLLAMLGIGIYMGLQGLLQNEIKKAASTAALAGAAVYYSASENGLPRPDPAKAKATATSVFNAVVANSGALKGLGVQLESVTNNDKNDSITVKAHGTFGTALLAPVGIKKIDMSTSSTARAIKQIAAGVGSRIGPITLIPDGTLASMQQTLELAFPLVDNPGIDLYIEQYQQVPYVVEACNSQECYDLTSAVTLVGSGKIVKNMQDGTDMIQGTCSIDLEKAKVRKASKLRFTHGNTFSSAYSGGDKVLSTYPTSVLLPAVYLLGFSSVCPNEDNCPVPAGFAPVDYIEE